MNGDREADERCNRATCGGTIKALALLEWIDASASRTKHEAAAWAAGERPYIWPRQPGRRKLYLEYMLGELRQMWDLTATLRWELLDLGMLDERSAAQLRDRERRAIDEWVGKG